MTDWKDIDKDLDRSWQRHWERRGFTPKTAQELIQSPAIQEWLQAEQIGYSGTWFKLYNCFWIKEWIDYNFTLQEAKPWMDTGFGLGGAEIAAYLRDKGCSPIGPSEPGHFKKLRQWQAEFEIWKVHSLEDKLKNRESKIQELKAELAMEREEMDKFRQKSKEWNERQVKELIEQNENLKKQVEKLQTQLANLQMGEQQTKIQASSRK